MQSSSKILLAYWAVRGRVQPVRYLLEYVGLPYEEKRYPIPEAMNWFGKEKFELDHPFPNLPYVKDGDRIVTETEAVYKYICKKAQRTDLLGKDDNDEVDVCTTRWMLYDLVYDVGVLAYDKKYEEIRDTTLEKKAAPKLERITKFLGDKDYLHGYLTYVDFILFELLEILFLMDPKYAEKFPKLKEYHSKILGQDWMKNYMQSDRFIKRPFYGPATWNPME